MSLARFRLFLLSEVITSENKKAALDLLHFVLFKKKKQDYFKIKKKHKQKRLIILLMIQTLVSVLLISILKY